MKRSIRKIAFGLFCLAVILSAGCGVESSDGILEKNNNEVLSYKTEDIRPLEDSPYALPNEIPQSIGLHRLDVQRPNMHEVENSDEVVNAILSTADQVAKIQSSDLIENVYLETGDRPITKSITDEGDYFRAFIQRDGSEEGDGEELWGELFLDTVADKFFGEGGMQDSSNCAILIKFRNNGEQSGNNYNFSNSNISTGINVDFWGDLHFWSNDEQHHYGYEIEDTRREYVNIFQPVGNEWFYTLIAMDENLGYRFITWQESNPVNHSYFAADLNGIYIPGDEMRGDHIWACMNFYTRANETSMDIESIDVYTFEKFSDIESAVLPEEPETYTYSNDDEKFQLAIQLFENEDYFNAYTHLKELNGYESSATYLAECERLLKTVEITNNHVAGMLKKALRKNGMPIYPYLYVFQAEKLESLDLSDSLIDDLGFIIYFPNLKELNLDNNAISDLMPLKDLYSLERLSLAENNISDLLPLSNLNNLQYLNLEENLLVDVSDLNNIPSLIELDLSNNHIHTVSGLNDLKSLESVDLSMNLISSIGALGNSPIKTLNIMNTNINNLYSVANFSELEELKAGFRYIWKGNTLYLLTRDYEIDNHFFLGLSGLEALTGHENLKTLYLARLEAQTLRPLTTLPNLESLTFHQYAGPNEPDVMASLVNLKELWLDSFWGGMEVTSYVANLTNLEKLSIDYGCYVEDISVIAGLTNLKELRMHHYNEDLSFLYPLKNLRLLQLIEWHDIDDYSPLLGLENLEYLDLEGMNVKDLSVISQMESLKFLQLNGVTINGISGIDQLKNLEGIRMRWPTIEHFGEENFFEKGWLQALEHLEYAEIDTWGYFDYGLDYGRNEYIELTEEPEDQGVDFPDFDYFWIENLDDINHLSQYVGNTNCLVIDGAFLGDYKEIKLTIPKYVRDLFIFSYSDQPVKIELNGDNNPGLERIVVGHMDFSKDYPEGFGFGNFIIDNLNGLAGSTNLKEVYINGAELNDISGLADCEKLETVVLKENNIADISALADKQYLHTIELNYNNINHIDPLTNCNRLKRLTLDGNPIVNRDLVNHLPLLEELSY